MKKKAVFGVLFAGFLLGVIVTAAVGLTLYFTVGTQPGGQALFANTQKEGGQDAQNKSQADKTETDDLTKDSAVKAKTEQTAAAKHAGDTWKAQTVYNGGEEVIFGGKKYQAKWWTQNTEPDEKDEANPWKYIGEAEQPALPEEDEEIPEDDAEPATALENPKAAPGAFRVVGYYPSWQPDKLDRIQYDTLTNIIYAFAIPNSDGSLKPLENEATAKKIIKEAHKNGVQVSIAIGGWSYQDTPLEPTFKEATNSADKIKTFGDNILKLVKDYGFDGVDMDWEHPRYQDVTAKQYEDLMLYLSEQLKKEGKLLTSAVLSGVSADGNVLYDAAAHSDAVLACVDWVNVMAYDGGDGDRHSSYDFAVNSANYWLKNRGLAPEKVVLGMPFYGRPSWKTYDEILSANAAAAETDVTNINGMQAYYNGIGTIQKKTEWAKENAGGVMVWEISQDTTDPKKSLLSAIRAVAK